MCFCFSFLFFPESSVNVLPRANVTGDEGTMPMLVKHIPWECSISCVVDNEVHILLLDAEHLCYL